MKSPFPGMDPYLERRWSDVHPSLLVMLKEALQPLLPRDLRARTEERVLLEDSGGELRRYRGDVAVVEVSPARVSEAGRGGAGMVTVQPVIIDIPTREPVDRSVQIVDLSSGNRVVTAIEVLSPSNKRAGAFNEAYRQKLDDYLAAEVNVVEIDLLRSSRARLEVAQQDLPVERRTPYMVSLRRASRPHQWVVYPLSLRQPLPRLPIPLRDTDPDVELDLQPLIERVYVAGGHDDIDYSKPPDPPLDLADAEWAAELVKSARGR
jgi:hypothetical protein